MVGRRYIAELIRLTANRPELDRVPSHLSNGHRAANRRRVRQLVVCANGVSYAGNGVHVCEEECVAAGGCLAYAKLQRNL